MWIHHCTGNKRKTKVLIFLHRRTNLSCVFLIRWTLLVQEICLDNIPEMYELADTFNASALRRACTLFVLEHFTKLSSQLWYAKSLHRYNFFGIFNFYFTHQVSIDLPNAGLQSLSSKLYLKFGVTWLIFSHGRSKLVPQPSYKTYRIPVWSSWFTLLR